MTSAITQTTAQTITLTRPDDWHLHVRDGDCLNSVMPHSARQFGRAMIMPNLKPPITTVEQAHSYRERILRALPAGSMFEPLMTLYLTQATSADEIKRASESPYIHGVKLYPAGATTHSDAGVNDLNQCVKALEAMQSLGMPLLIHGEVVDPEVDIFDREKIFIDRILIPLRKNFPELKIVFEHITTQEAAEFVMSATGAPLGATITAHHLLYNRNALLVGGVKPHYYCLPVLKRERHRQALIAAATSGNPRFFLGTDSAPHTRLNKENDCGCAGCYTAYAALEFYAEAFEQANALERLEGFASFYGADFYGLPRNQTTITLKCESWIAPKHFEIISKNTITPDTNIANTLASNIDVAEFVPEVISDEIIPTIIPLRAGSPIKWRFQDDAIIN